MKKVAIFLADGFEEVEAITPHDILTRAGIQVDLVSITNQLEITSTHNLKIIANQTIEQIETKNYDMLILPGGMPGTNHLNESEKLKNLLKIANQNNQNIAAICAAPTVLAKTGILNGKTATCYPGLEQTLIENGAQTQKQTVVKDQNLITSQGPGTALNFALTLAETLVGEKKVQEVAKAFLA